MFVSKIFNNILLYCKWRHQHDQSVLYKNTNIRIVLNIKSCVGLESASTLHTKICMGIASPSHYHYLITVWTLCYHCVTANKIIFRHIVVFVWFLLSLRIASSKRWKSLVLEDEILKFTSKISLETCILLTVESL